MFQQQIELRDTLIIINPSRYPQYVKILKKILKHVDPQRIIESQSKDDFIEQVRRFLYSDIPNLLVWGGDGTANSTIDTLMKESVNKSIDLSLKRVGFLRGGSGNGIQDSYDVPTGMIKQLKEFNESIENNYKILVDLVSVRQGLNIDYCQLAGLGVDAQILDYRDKMVYKRGPKKGKIKSGIFQYVIAGAKVYKDGFPKKARPFLLEMKKGKFAYKGTRTKAEFAFKEYRGTKYPRMIEVGTRPYYAKMFKICPDVVCNDAQLGVYVFNFPTRRSVIHNLRLLWQGHHGQINERASKKGAPYIERYEVGSCQISSKNSFPYHIDGELKFADKTSDDGLYKIDIKIHPKKINFIVPPRFYRKFRLVYDGDSQIIE